MFTHSEQGKFRWQAKAMPSGHVQVPEYVWHTSGQGQMTPVEVRENIIAQKRWRKPRRVNAAVVDSGVFVAYAVGCEGIMNVFPLFHVNTHKALENTTHIHTSYCSVRIFLKRSILFHKDSQRTEV